MAVPDRNTMGKVEKKKKEEEKKLFSVTCALQKQPLSRSEPPLPWEPQVFVKKRTRRETRVLPKAHYSNCSRPSVTSAGDFGR